ncbi:unnamed protein product, partial [Ixodes pacificus]
VLALFRQVLCYEGAVSAQQDRGWSMERLLAIRNFFRRWFCRQKDPSACHPASHQQAVTDFGIHQSVQGVKHEELGDHKDPTDDFQRATPRPAQQKSPFTHSLKCGRF